MFVKLRKASSAFGGKSDGLSRNIHCTLHCCRFDHQQTSDGSAMWSHLTLSGEGGRRSMHHDQRVGTLRRRCLSTALSKLVAILALVLSVVWCAHAQQP